MNKFKYTIIFSFFVLLVFGFGFFVYSSKTEKVLSELASTSTPSAILKMSFGSKEITIPFSPGSNLYDIMLESKERGEITFSAQKYTALGFFVTEIGDLKHGDGNNLIYYLNGQEAQVGVSNYEPKDGDVIEWKLEE